MIKVGINNIIIYVLFRGVGCIFTEMVTGVATFPGMKDAIDQLDRIWRVSRKDTAMCLKLIHSYIRVLTTP